LKSKIDYGYFETKQNLRNTAASPMS